MGDLCGCCSLTAVTGSSAGQGVKGWGLRELAPSFVVPGPAGVAIRDRLRVSETDAVVLAEVGRFLLAAWHLDVHGNPVGEPQRFFYDLSGSAVSRCRHQSVPYTLAPGAAAAGRG